MLGYCTNVHRVCCFQDILKTIETQVSTVSGLVDFPLGVGLWFPKIAISGVDIPKLKDVLHQHDLSVFTINGFPMNDFHADIVKHDVYLPTWATEDRLSYTIQIASLLAELVDTDSAGISTLPLGWNSDSFTNQDAAAMLLRCVDALEDLANTSGTLIHLDVEAEPGCRLQTSSDIAKFFLEEYGDDQRIRQYLRVCHDTCHAAVMREPAESCIDHYQQAGVTIGKAQLSSAISTTPTNPHLQAIAERRYLHQATVLNDEGFHFFEDLPDVPIDQLNGELRIHFHVPIHLEQFASLQTTQAEITPLYSSTQGLWGDRLGSRNIYLGCIP